MGVFKDKTVPWPGKAYYLTDNYKFIIRTMKYAEDYKSKLNEEV